MNILELFHTNHTELYALFENVAHNNVTAAVLLEKMCASFTQPEKTTQKIHALEHENDDLTHQIYEKLEKIFVTPIDREDATVLAHALDDVTDGIHDSAEYLTIYQVEKIRQPAQIMSGIIVQGARMIDASLPHIRTSATFDDILPSIDALHRLENEADDVRRKGLKELFHKPKDPIDVIRWRDIYQTMESVTDTMEDVADIFRHLVTKYR